MDKKEEIVFYIKKYRELDDQRERELEMLVLTKLIEIDPRCEVPYNDFYFNHYYNRGVLYGYLDENDKAIVDYTKAIEINPKHTLARGNRGVCYEGLGDLNHAIADFEECVKIDPGSIHLINLKRLRDGAKKNDEN